MPYSLGEFCDRALIAEDTIPQWGQVDTSKKGTIHTHIYEMYMNTVHGFYFISGILRSMCITRNYYACLVLLICNDHYSREYNRREKDAKIVMFFLFFFTETMELCVIHFFCPCPVVSLSFPHDYVMSRSNKGGTCCCLHHKNVINVCNE